MPLMQCPICGYQARTKYKMNRHANTHLKCWPCRLSFTSTSEALEHEAVCNKTVAKQCGLCSVQCDSNEKMEEHLVQHHYIALKKESFEFDNEKEYVDWKKQIESSQKSLYIIVTSNILSDKKTSYLICHRSGKPRISKTEDTRLRQMKKLGSNKINAYCPSRMRVTFYNDGRVAVFFVSTHVGHDFDIARLQLDKQYRAELAAQMIQKIPLDNILEAEKEIFKGNMKLTGDGDEPVELSRSNLLSRKDLHNIARDFHVGKEIVLKVGSSKTKTESRTLEQAKAKMNEAMDMAVNEAQIDALYEQAKYVESLMESLATKPTTSVEIATLPSATSTTLLPLNRVFSRESVQTKHIKLDHHVSIIWP